MLRKLQHVLTVFLIVYAAVFYGMADYVPLVRIIHQFGTALVFGLWIFSLWRSGRGWPTTPLDVPLWLLLAASVLSAALSREPRVSLEYVWNYLVLALTFYFFVDQIRQGRLRWILEGIFLFAGFFVLASFTEMFAWYFGWPISPTYGLGWLEADGFTFPPLLHNASFLSGNPNMAGSYGMILLPITAAWALTSKQKDTRLGLGILATGLLPATLLTQSRGALLGLIVVATSTLASTITTRLLRSRFSDNFPLLRSPSLFVVELLLVSLLATAGVVGFTAFSTDEFSRTDLWLSAIRMFEEHPVLGVGPFQFGSNTYWYPNWDRPSGLIGFHHPHNAILHLLAEGGVVTFALITAVIVRTLRLWWTGWGLANAEQRSRLQAILATFAGFAIHNAVDYFGTMRPLIVLLAMAALIVAPFPATAAFSHNSRFTRSRVLLALSTLTLFLAQVGFVPILRGLWQYREATKAVATSNHVQALSSIRAAQRADPWFDLYPLEEAYILALAAHKSPEAYLEAAIKSHEEALERNPVWDLGWHNLASLYAQNDDLAPAIKAEQHAIAIHPHNSEYHFQLGVYLLDSGNIDAARTPLFRALELHPPLAASDFWTDPEYPERTAILDDAFAYFSDRPKQATEIAMYAGKVELGTQFQKQIRDLSSAWNKVNYEAAWGESACLLCFYLPPDQYLLRAEHTLQNARQLEHAITAENDAKVALVLSEGQAVWAYYILARLDENRDSTEVNELLLKAVAPPTNRSPRFSIVFYGVSSSIDILPQARTPLLSPYAYEPWLVLGEHLRAAGDWEKALRLYELILVLDPYDRTAQQQVALLTERTTVERASTSVAAPAR